MPNAMFVPSQSPMLRPVSPLANAPFPEVVWWLAEEDTYHRILPA